MATSAAMILHKSNECAAITLPSKAVSPSLWRHVHPLGTALKLCLLPRVQVVHLLHWPTWQYVRPNN